MKGWLIFIVLIVHSFSCFDEINLVVEDFIQDVFLRLPLQKGLQFGFTYLIRLRSCCRISSFSFSLRTESFLRKKESSIRKKRRRRTTKFSHR